MTSLKLAVQQYDWGIKGTNALVARLAHAGAHIGSISETSPYAELWLGAHPNGQSRVLPSEEPLREYLTKRGLSEIPYLFKVLSVGQALSIQSHPNATLAQQLHRKRPDLYKDPNPKPEMAIALTPFRALLGFRTWPQIATSLTNFPLLATTLGLQQLDMASCTRSCYERLMRLESSTVQQLIDEVLSHPESSDPCLFQLIDDLNRIYPGGDVGVLSVFFLNLLELSPGEAVFIPADTPHAYLSGEILECMQNSDNVIRGGLTPKFKDVDILIASLSYEPFQGERVQPVRDNQGWSTWRPLCIFGVTLVNSDGQWISEATAIGIVLKGSARISGIRRVFGWAGLFEPNQMAKVSDCSPDFVMYVADSRV